jgi:hypothetical protein
MFSYPVQSRDDPTFVLGLLGSVWTLYYGGRKPLQALVAADLELLKQQRINTDEIIACASRDAIPLYHTEHWTPLAIDLDTLAAPPGIVSLPLLCNRITAPTVMLHEGMDYKLADGKFVFAPGVLEDTAVPKQDGKAYLWGVRGKYDHGYLNKHFGRIFGLLGETCQKHKDTLNALIDCLMFGTTFARLHTAIATCLGAPCTRGEETLLHDATDGRGRFLATDKAVYRTTATARLAVAIGDTVPAGTPLVDAIRIYDFRRLPSTIKEVVVPAGMHSGDGVITAAVADLPFRNCIVICMDLTRLADVMPLVDRIVPPQTGVCYASLD